MIDKEKQRFPSLLLALSALIFCVSCNRNAPEKLAKPNTQTVNTNSNGGAITDPFQEIKSQSYWEKVEEITLTTFPSKDTEKTIFTKTQLLKDGTAIKRDLAENKVYFGEIKSQEFEKASRILEESRFLYQTSASDSQPLMQTSIVIGNKRKRVAIGKESPAEVKTALVAVKRAISSIKWNQIGTKP